MVRGGERGYSGIDCEDTKAVFDWVAENAGENKSIIVIARLGNREYSRNINWQRLRDVRDYIYMVRGIPRERFVLAEGERVQGLGQVDIYIGGELRVIFKMKRNKDFFTGCQT